MKAHAPLLSAAAALLLAQGAARAAADPGCAAKCTTAGHCCQGANSACQKPSCAMGCLAAAAASSEAACNATCMAAGGKTPGSSGCTYAVPHSNVSFQMCGTCRAEPAPAWWPPSATPPNGDPPGWWPPGYSLKDCSSCDNVGGDPLGECKLGCMFAFRSALKPQPPAAPPPPAPRPEPPVCGPFPSAQKGALNPWSGCSVGADLNFSSVFSDGAVLQMQPAKSAVYGPLGSGASAGAKVSVTVSEGSSDESLVELYSVEATVDAAAGQWKAFLKPHAGGGSYTITAKCSSGCSGSAELKGLTFGDVWYCAGQSNMALPFQFTYARNATIKKIKAKQLSDIRVTGEHARFQTFVTSCWAAFSIPWRCPRTGLKGNMNADQPWISLEEAVGGTDNATMPSYGEAPLDHFSSTCLYFGASLSEGLGAAPPPIGATARASVCSWSWRASPRAEPARGVCGQGSCTLPGEDP